MKSCDTPLCENQTVRARYCRRCYDRLREQTPERKSWVARYAKTAKAKEAHRLANQAYRDAGKVEQGVCVCCEGPTSNLRALRCLACYRARVLPLARKRGLMAIHGRPV